MRDKIEIMRRTTECNRCRTVHSVVGMPGQKVTAEFTCECGNRLVLVSEFPS